MDNQIIYPIIQDMQLTNLVYPDMPPNIQFNRNIYYWFDVNSPKCTYLNLTNIEYDPSYITHTYYSNHMCYGCIYALNRCYIMSFNLHTQIFKQYTYTYNMFDIKILPCCTFKALDKDTFVLYMSNDIYILKDNKIECISPIISEYTNLLDIKGYRISNVYSTKTRIFIRLTYSISFGISSIILIELKNLLIINHIIISNLCDINIYNKKYICIYSQYDKWDIYKRTLSNKIHTYDYRKSTTESGISVLNIINNYVIYTTYDYFANNVCKIYDILLNKIYIYNSCFKYTTSKYILCCHRYNTIIFSGHDSKTVYKIYLPIRFPDIRDELLTE